MPFSKVDRERRIVSGFATLDNVDKQADIVTSEASIKAFKKFRGNIREMHGPVAVGKMVSFKEDKYFDPETKKFYSGVFVSAYISKGAQNTWEKVLDGTLSGFSIGGRMNKWDDAFDEGMEKKVRIIKEYDLTELSLVDNPANQFANILSIEKVDGVDTIKGDGIETEIENVFWDSDNNIIMLSENDVELSPTSGNPMQNIGFVEKNDSDKVDMVKFLVDSAKGINLSKMNKEEDPMNEATENIVEETVTKSDDVVEEAQVAPEADAVTEDAPVEEAAADETEKADETTDVSKSDDVAVETPVQDSTEVSKSEEIVDAVSEIKNTLASAFSDLTAVVKAQATQIAELSKSIEAVKNEVTASKDVFNELGKRVDAVEHDTAFRKSGDLGEIVQETQPEQVEKSLWGGRFLKTADLFR
jgi:hypothetical protein